jgi:hypothetical protein
MLRPQNLAMTPRAGVPCPPAIHQREEFAKSARAFRIHGTTSAPLRPILVLLGAVRLSACVQNTIKVESAWQAKVPRNRTFTRVLVVSGPPDVDARGAFESAMVAQLRSSTVQAVASCDATPLKDPLTRETV